MSRTGKVQTVCGLISPSELGKTMVHEHLSMNFDVAYVEPADPSDSDFPFAMENLGWIRYHPYSHRLNLRLDGADCAAAVEAELARYRQLGGGTVVECTSHGIQRRASFLRQLSRATGVHVVAGTGYYVAASQASDAHRVPVEEMVRLMADEIDDGCRDAGGIRCGIVGEIGCSWPLHDFERKAVTAAAMVQAQFKCPVSIHPGRDPQSPTEIVRIFQEAGGNVDQLAICHLDRTFSTEEELLSFAQLGSFLEFDLFGNECSFYQLNQKFSMPSDAQRIERLIGLIDHGYAEKILISHDIHTKHRLTKFGGHGYSHILENIVPRMEAKGIAAHRIEQILVTNPAQWLTFN